jgi:hypothetical protein
MAQRTHSGFAAAGLIVAPGAWAVHQQSVYVLTRYSCIDRIFVIPFVTLAAIAVIAGAAWLSARSAGIFDRQADAIPDTRVRTKLFLAQLGFLASGLFLAAVVLQGAASLILDSCQR